MVGGGSLSAPGPSCQMFCETLRRRGRGGFWGANLFFICLRRARPGGIMGLRRTDATLFSGAGGPMGLTWWPRLHGQCGEGQLMLGWGWAEKWLSPGLGDGRVTRLSLYGGLNMVVV